VVVIDVQQGLCEDSEAREGTRGVIARINVVTAKARSAHVPVIFVQHESQNGYLEFASREWQLAGGLVAGDDDLRIRKTTSDSFLRTTLASTLEDLGVNELVICGMHTEYCVDVTTRRALAHGFPVILVEDGHFPEGNPALTREQIIAHHNVLLTRVWSFGPRVRTVSSSALTFDSA
jgi:nicotinamidase-related amidase